MIRHCRPFQALNDKPNLFFNAVSRAFLYSLVTVGMVLSPGFAKAETFQEALISVYNSNPRLLAARAQVREVDENYIQARSEGRFNANLAGNIGPAILRSSGPIVPGVPDQTFTREDFPASGQFQIIQPLYQGGRVRALKDQAKAGILAAREQLRNSEQDLMMQGANAYANVLRDEEAARIRRNNVSVLARQEMAAKDRFDVGVGTKTDIAQAQSRLAAAESGLAMADAQLQASRATYIRVIGHVPADLQSVPAFDLPPTLAAALALARENNPALLAAIYNQEASKAGVDVAKSAHKPVITLNGALAGQRLQIAGLPTNDLGSVTAQITIPLFSGGNNKSRVRQARQAQTRMGFEISDTERMIDEGVRQVWAQLEAARLTLKSTRLQVQASEVAFTGVELEQSVGTRTTLDVLDAEQEVLNSKLSEIDAELNLNLATFQLLTVLGVFDAQGIRLPIDYYDPVDNFDKVKSDRFSRLTDKIVPETLKSTVKDMVK